MTRSRIIMQSESLLPRTYKRSLFLALAAVGALLALFSASAQAEDPFAIEPGTFATELSTNQAGAHPDLRTKFKINENPDHSPAGGTPRNLKVILPKGLIGAPTATPTCPLRNAIDYLRPCPLEAAVGQVQVVLNYPPVPALTINAIVYAVNPYPGEPAAFAFNAIFPVRLDTYVRADGDYGVTATATNLTEAASVVKADLTLWGVPADHNGPGPLLDIDAGRTFGGPSGAPRVPFLTNPTECSPNPLTSSINLETWQRPVQIAAAEYSLGTITGCDQLEFAPTISAQPTTKFADAPSGLDFKLHIPQHDTLVGANEVQSLSVLASEGQFTLSFGGQTTGDLLFNASAAEVQSALEALSTIDVGNVAVSGGPGDETGSTPYRLIFKGALGFKDVEEITVADAAAPLQITNGSGTFPGSAAVSTVVPGVPNGSPGAELAAAHLKDATVTLPAGMTVNPSSANGLGACSLEQIGMSATGQPNGNPVSCPDNSKLGTVEAVSPAIGHPLPGSLYLAEQNANPFGSLLALYLVIDDPVAGILVKLPGKVEADPISGRLTVSFKDNPQLPVEDLDLSLFKGPRAALKTPTSCTTHTTTSTLVPWSSPAAGNATPASSFTLTNGPDGGACLPDGAGAPNKPSFSAGTLDPTAKAFTPFVMKLSREDGSQPIKALDVTLPKGLLGKLAGIPYCPEAALASAATKSGRSEQASSSCPGSSQVGTVNVGAGAGSDPLYVAGKAYLAGPYRGAQLSLAIITPAVAGPFDLGTVVVRTALNVDPETAQIHAVSDPIPTILQGIPLDIRQIALNMNKPSFTLNPTNCAPSSVLGSAISLFDQSASFADPFQVGGCRHLGFKPSLTISLKGATKRAGYPALTATLKARPGDANIATTSVALPHSAFLAQNHIKTVCTRVQFAQAGGNGARCPAGSIYGSAKATSPLLEDALEGPVFLRSSSNPLPDLVVALHGQIEIVLVGRIDSKNGGIRTTFDAVPDAPVSKFVLSMNGGKRGLLRNSRNLCGSVSKSSVHFQAQSGTKLSFRPVIRSGCGKKAKKQAGKRAGGRRG